MRTFPLFDASVMRSLAAGLSLLATGCGGYQVDELPAAGHSMAPTRSVNSDGVSSLSAHREAAAVAEMATVAARGSKNPAAQPSFSSAILSDQESASEEEESQRGESAASSPRSEIFSLERFFTGGTPSVSGCCHLLLYYGQGPTDIARFKSGADVLAALTDEEAAIATFGASPFIRTRTGLRYHMTGGPIFNSQVGEAHRDQCLSTFALLRLDRRQPIKLRNGSLTLAELLSESAANVSLDQRELPWTAIALATYLPPKKTWRNRFDQEISFSQLARRLIQRMSAAESCGGTHIIQALLVIDRADTEFSILDQATREQLAGFLSNSVERAAANQLDDGSWNLEWLAAHRPSGPEPSAVAFAERLLLSGHIAELLTWLPPERRPTARVYQRAAEWLSTNLLSTEVESNESWICPYSHGALAVRQIRSQPVQGCNVSGLSRFVSSTTEDH